MRSLASASLVEVAEHVDRAAAATARPVDRGAGKAGPLHVRAGQAEFVGLGEIEGSVVLGLLWGRSGRRRRLPDRAGAKAPARATSETTDGCGDAAVVQDTLLKAIPPRNILARKVMYVN